MLVHVTRYVAVQGLVAAQIEDELDRAQGSAALWRRRRRGAAARRAARALGERLRPDQRARWRETAPGRWERCRLPSSRPRRARVRVLEINGTRRRRARVHRPPDGVTVIAVGGDKLSPWPDAGGAVASATTCAPRRCTTRSCRWAAGSATGPATSICAASTPPRELQSTGTATSRSPTRSCSRSSTRWRRVERHSEGLRPVRPHEPAGLLVTAQAKMRCGRRMELSLLGRRHRDDQLRARLGRAGGEPRRSSTDWLAADRRRPQRTRATCSAGGNLVWERGAGEDVAAAARRVADGAERHDRRVADPMARYIRCAAARRRADRLDGRASSTTATAAEHVALAGERVGLTTRALYPPRARRRRRTTSADCSPRPTSDSTSPPRSSERALRDTLRLWEAGALRKPASGPTRPNGPVDPTRPPAERGLLLPLPARSRARPTSRSRRRSRRSAFSFPTRPTHRPIEYMIPERYWDGLRRRMNLLEHVGRA